MTTLLEKLDCDQRFARILPIVGDTLFNQRIAIVGNHDSSQLIEDLICCGINKFDLIASGSNKHEQINETMANLQARLNFSITSNYFQTEAYDQQRALTPPTLIIANGGKREFEIARTIVQSTGAPGIFSIQLANGINLICLLLPDERLELPDEVFENSLQNSDLFNTINLNSIIANYAKGLLLIGTEFARPDINELLASNQRIIMIGHPSWPWAIKSMAATELQKFLSLPQSQPIYKSPVNKSASLANKNILIVGLGSLGSIAAEILNRLQANLVLLDGEQIDAANPIRQIYRMDQLGMAKAQGCLSILIGARTGQYQSFSERHWSWQSLESDCRQSLTAYQTAIDNEPASLEQFNRIIEKHNFDSAIIATGTINDRIISQLLRKAGIPHTVVSCYARARYFEAMLVTATGPCFGCLRGHLYLGSTPSLTLEQRALYISNEHDLVSEPATRIETARAARLAAQLVYEIDQPMRAKWLQQALTAEETFFLGGNIAERQINNQSGNISEWAYGIETAGEVRLFGLSDISGRGDYLECWDCGRQLPIAIKYLSGI